MMPVYWKEETGISEVAVLPSASLSLFLSVPLIKYICALGGCCCTLCSYKTMCTVDTTRFGVGFEQSFLRSPSSDGLEFWHFGFGCSRCRLLSDPARGCLWLCAAESVELLVRPDGRATVSTEAHHNSSTWEEQQQLALAVRAGRVRSASTATSAIRGCRSTAQQLVPSEAVDQRRNSQNASVVRNGWTVGFPWWRRSRSRRDFRINLDHLRAGYFQRDLDYQITISSTRSAWHSFSRHVRKSFSFSFFEKKLFLFLFF